MTSKGKEDNGSKARPECGRRRLKPRHKFTKDDLKILGQLFEQNPYPGFKTKDRLAQQFGCQVYVIENWFQNKRTRLLLPKLRGKSFDTRRTHKSRDYMLTGHQDTKVQAPNCTTGQDSDAQVAPWSLSVYSVETQEASGSCDSVIQSIRARSSVAVCHQGASGNGSSFNFRSTSFPPPPMCEQYPMRDWPDTWGSQCSTSSVFGCVPSVQGQWQMDGNCSLPFPEQQQNNWGDQQQPPHSYQETSFAGCVIEQQGPRDLGQQVPFFLSGHQEQFGPSNGDAAGSQMQPAPLQEAVGAPMPLWLDGQQGAANSCVYSPAERGPIKTYPQAPQGCAGTSLQFMSCRNLGSSIGAEVESRNLTSFCETHNT